jgi:hypothetical protein
MSIAPVAPAMVRFMVLLMMSTNDDDVVRLGVLEPYARPIRPDRTK